MDLKKFSQDLSSMLIENTIMELKLKAIKEETEKINRVAEKYEQFSEINLILTGIVVTLEKIINQ